MHPNLFAMALWDFGKYQGADEIDISRQHCLSWLRRRWRGCMGSCHAGDPECDWHWITDCCREKLS